MNNISPRIVIIGAGYGGMMATLRLAGKSRRQNLDITLVNAVDVFVERPRLHEWSTHKPLKNRPIRTMLRGKRVNFMEGQVTAIEASQKMITVQTQSGQQHLAYDYLVYALGSTIDRNSVPGVSDYAYTFIPQGLRSAESLREVLPALAKTGRRVVVVGGGLTGIESAAQIKGVYPSLQVSLLTEGECGVFSKRQVQDYMRESLIRQDVHLCEHTHVKEVTAHEIILADGSAIAYDLCLWAGGFKGLPFAANAGIAINERGRILVDPYLRSVTYLEIYAVGDAAFPTEPTGAPPRMSAWFAQTTGAHAADNLSRLLRNKPQKPFGFSTQGQCIALGAKNGVGFGSYPNDRPVGPIIYGMLAVPQRVAVMIYLMLQFELERRWPGSFVWFGKGRHAAASPASSLNPKSQRTT